MGCSTLFLLLAMFTISTHARTTPDNGGFFSRIPELQNEMEPDQFKYTTNSGARGCKVSDGRRFGFAILF